MQKSVYFDKLRLLGINGILLNKLDKIVFWDTLREVTDTRVIKDNEINIEWVYIQYKEHYTQENILNLLGLFNNENIVRVYKSILQSTYNSRPIGEIIHRYFILNIVASLMFNINSINTYDAVEKINYGDNNIILALIDIIKSIMSYIIYIVSKEDILRADKISNKEMKKMSKVDDSFDKTLIIEWVDGVLHIKDSENTSNKYIEYIEIQHKDGRESKRITEELLFYDLTIKGCMTEKPYVDLEKFGETEPLF